MPPATRRRARRLTDAQLEEMLALTSHADSVELKLTVPDSERRATVTGLGMDPLDAQIRQVFFLDTPDLALNQAGVVGASPGRRYGLTAGRTDGVRADTTFR